MGTPPLVVFGPDLTGGVAGVQDLPRRPGAAPVRVTQPRRHGPPYDKVQSDEQRGWRQDGQQNSAPGPGTAKESTTTTAATTAAKTTAASRA